MLQEFLEKHKIGPQKIAVGVSGGADSLAAVLFCNQELKPLGYQIIALTVDHKLRPTSSKEAIFVADIMKINNIEHHTLIWRGEKPKTGIEETARSARYDLLAKWCFKNNVKYLITAHHLLDQAETFLMRLERGSGLDGLCGMKEITPHQNLFILRPFLKTHPNIFKTYLTKKDITWVEDESNHDNNLLRVKMRNFLPVLEKQTGITALQIADTMERLQSSRSYFERKTQNILENHFKNFENTAFACKVEFFQNLENEIQYRLTSHLLKKIAGTSYPPEAQKLLSLLSKIKQTNFKTATLNHCKILRRSNFLWFLPEQKTFSGNIDHLWKEYTLKHAEYKKTKLPAEIKRLLLASHR